MPENKKIAAAADLPFIGLCCPKCEYNLTGTTEPRCPECGETFDPAKLRPPKSSWRSGSWWRCRPSWWVTLSSVLLAVYLPNTWIFWIDYGWGGYRMFWVKIFPTLPSVVPTMWCLHLRGDRSAFSDSEIVMIFGVATIILMSACALLGRRSRRWLLAVCIVMFVLQIFNGLGSYAIFRA